MANRIQPHPNPPYWLSDGTLNASGQLKLYAAGTSTPKVAYKDASGTSYGSTIDLDSAGLPDEGPIYWDTSALYKVEVYKDNGAGGYTLDDTIDNFGEVIVDSIQNIITATTWTVDGVGGTSTTFATLAAAMNSARNYIIMGGGGLTINVNAGTYTDEVIDLSHPQGKYITISGAGATTIYERTTNPLPIFTLESGSEFGEISNLTLEENDTTSYPLFSIKEGAKLYDSSFLYLDCNSLAGSGMIVEEGGFANMTGIYLLNLRAGTKGIEITSSGQAVIDSLYCDTTSGAGDVAYADGAGARMYIGTLRIDSSDANKFNSGVTAANLADVHLGTSIEVADCVTGIAIEGSGRIIIEDTTPTYTNNTADYSDTPDERPNQNTATTGDNNGGIIIAL